MLFRSLELAAVSMVILTAGGPARGAEIACTVADPTRTPLNVRDAPNGRVVMTLSNGAKVGQAGARDHRGKRWSLVANEAGPLGWSSLPISTTSPSIAISRNPRRCGRVRQATSALRWPFFVPVHDPFLFHPIRL
jgi:hypothetical protein